MLDAALGYIQAGYSVIPVRGNDKRPAVKWEAYQSQYASAEEAETWWAEMPEANVGIVTGSISNLTVIDVDGQTGLNSLKEHGITLPKTRVIRTPNGWHIYCSYNPDLHTGAAFLPGLDVRNDGGFVVAPPSVINGNAYTLFRDYEVASFDSPPDVLLARSRKNGGVTPEEGQPTWVTDTLAGTGEGQRNQQATRLAGYFRSKDMPEDVILQVMLPFAQKCSPPLEERELLTIIQSVGKYPITQGPGSERDTNVTDSVTGFERDENVTQTVTLAEMVGKWVSDSNGWFSTDELDRDLSIRLFPDKNNRRQILHRLHEKGVLTQHPTENKKFRRIDKNLERLNFRNTRVGPGLDIQWPMGIEKLVKLYPGNLVVVAGDGNSGKTAMLLNLVRLNMDRFEMHYFNLEMADEEFRLRLDIFRELDIEDWNFEAWNRQRDFADVIVPGAINIVDFLDLDGEHNLAATRLAEICERVGKGLAVVALQKKMNTKLAKGAEGTADRARLYLSMTKNRVTILKGKNPTNPEVNPNGLSMRFKLLRGSYFIPQEEEWRHEEEE